jgi:hypothetical protein
MKQLIGAGVALVVAVCGNAHATPVVYSIYGVTDGQLGSLTFTSAPVTLTFRGDTEDVTMTTSGGVVEYRIDQGEATVAVTVQGSTTVASIDRGQVYVHYAVQDRLVGFGSNAVGPYYPFTLACGETPATCNYKGGGFSSTVIVSAVADVLSNSSDIPFYSSAVLDLPETLTRSTLLTGYINACGVAYMFQAGSPPCPSPPATLIHTSQGYFYLKDENLSKGLFTAEVSRESDD